MRRDEENLKRFLDHSQYCIDRVDNLIKDSGESYNEISSGYVICDLIDTLCGFKKTYPMLVIDIKSIKEHYRTIEGQQGSLNYE